MKVNIEKAHEYLKSLGIEKDTDEIKVEIKDLDGEGNYTVKTNKYKDGEVIQSIVSKHSLSPREMNCAMKGSSEAHPVIR